MLMGCHLDLFGWCVDDAYGLSGPPRRAVVVDCLDSTSLMMVNDCCTVVASERLMVESGTQYNND
jgi:hypothetical protein